MWGTLTYLLPELNKGCGGAGEPLDPSPVPIPGQEQEGQLPSRALLTWTLFFQKQVPWLCEEPK